MPTELSVSRAGVSSKTVVLAITTSVVIKIGWASLPVCTRDPTPIVEIYRFVKYHEKYILNLSTLSPKTKLYTGSVS